MPLQTTAVFNASDNVQSGDVACITLSVVADDILEPLVEFLVLFEPNPDALIPVESPDFTRVLVVDTTAQGKSLTNLKSCTVYIASVKACYVLL